MSAAAELSDVEAEVVSYLKRAGATTPEAAVDMDHLVGHLHKSKTILAWLLTSCIEKGAVGSFDGKDGKKFWARA
ncbi:MAG: hypothetical protein ACT4PT_08415 [Methanobacteriota archaeon]